MSQRTRTPRVDTRWLDPQVEAAALRAQERHEQDSAAAAYDARLARERQQEAAHRARRAAFQQAVLRREPPQGWDA